MKAVFSTSVSAIAFLSAGMAAAQAPQADPTVQAVPEATGEAPPVTTNDQGEIVVTGSRIARRDYLSATPISTVGSETLLETPSVNVEATLNQLPQFAQGQNQSAIGAVAGGGRATLNLRGLGETRNLILLDGRRLPLSSAFAVVDVNIIPPSIIEGIETITGGASAVYGSDAMSGVVNFKTRRSFEGLQIDARKGLSFRGDAGTFDVSLLGGLKAADGRARALLSIGYSERDVLWGQDRPEFFAQGVLSSFIGQGTFVPSANNLPTQAAVNAVFARYGVAPGTVPNARSLGFNDNGTLFSQIGAVNYSGPSTFQYSLLGGTVRQPVTMQEYVVQPMERKNVFAKFEYDLATNLTAYAQVLYVDSRVTGQVGFSPTLFVVPTIPVSNPFIPADLRTVLASRPSPNADFTLNKRFVSFEDRKFHSDAQTSQYIVGLRGDVGVSDWRFDVYGLHDEMDLVETQDKALLLSRMRALLFAPDGGNSICAGGFNPFGLGPSAAISPACRDYIETETHDVTKTRQNVFEANLSGSLFELPGGTAKFSLTGTYRENEFSFDPDNARESSDIIGTLLTAPASGEISVKEAAAELLLPLIRDFAIARRLELTLGYRISDYDVSGSFSTYKADLVWEPVRSLLLRGGYEKAIRAPNIGELYSSAQAAQAQIGSPPSAGDPCDVRTSARAAGGAQLATLCVATGVPANIIGSYQYTTVAVGAVASGSTALEPEKADTYTLGAVWSPDFAGPLLRGLTLSVDYYDITVDNVISQVAGPTAINKCYNLDGSNPSYDPTNIYCALIARNAASGDITTVATPYLNLGGLRTSGIDVQADWRIDLAEIGLAKGRLNLNVIVNFLDRYEVKLLPESPWLDYGGTIDGTQAATTPPVGLPLPDYKIFANVSYELGGAQLGVRWRYLPKMDDVTAVTRPASPAPGVPSYQLWDVNASIDINDRFTLRGGINNVFDKDPVTIAGTPGLTQPGTYDIIGRSFYVAATTRF
ncbi:TonB-dependent receptor domain-containing protein [Allosphingosinicella deserti]|nr:TonB-dependent receptor [Sphingomonas deserti]